MMDDKYNIPTGYNSDLVKQALEAGDLAAQQKRTAGTNVVNNAEQGMHDMLGRMQLQTERDVADRRMKALRSGTTSSGLAAMEMQNIQAGQIGAQQIMQDARTQRLDVESQYAGAEATNRQYMFEMLNQNTKDVAAIDAQKYSSGVIPQVQDLFPDAPADVIEAIAKSFDSSQELSTDEQNLIDNYKNGITGSSVEAQNAKYKDDFGFDEASINKLFGPKMLTKDQFIEVYRDNNSVLSRTVGQRNRQYDEYVQDYANRN